MRHLRSGLLCATLVAGVFATSASAQDVILDVLYCNPSFSRFHEPIAEAFMEQHPEIGINFLAPCANYDEGHQQMLRNAVTNQLPDVYYSGFHLLSELTGRLAERGQIIELGPLLEEEGEEFINANFDPKLLALGRVDDVQYGIPFNASSPIIYFNADLVRQAGGDPENMPSKWDDLVELAADINELGSDISGIAYDIHAWPDDWLWQALIYQQGGALISEDEASVGFNNELGLNALSISRRLVAEGGMELIDRDQSMQQFGAGLTGIYFATPAQLARVSGLVGERFDLRTAVFPLDNPEEGGVPTGGNAVIVLSDEAEKQEAAWKFVTFVTGPEAQSIVVQTAGYLPTNRRALGEDYLAPFYEANPNFATAPSQIDRSWPWVGYPGGESVRIWRTQRDLIASVMRGDLSVEEGLEQIVSETEALMR
ncbi:ABC transporter substrate-binding protein [Aquibaculum arenosum]|uniref:ABC transporter substrate-binding protein n=1 Tax=Aquibaculum arenosum TaxID=3032591 RepID=A0ABT5YM89_9PROT|nr:ABC transporter substrate-binding protein [Fodinicurvata sp. CAU 1616]MDF2095958.1 ABC transporter substrate-binding protein [Fodinicurvata sp. CAU 1616]